MPMLSCTAVNTERVDGTGITCNMHVQRAQSTANSVDLSFVDGTSIVLMFLYSETLWSATADWSLLMVPLSLLGHSWRN